MGSLTEYFTFENAKAAKLDLSRMKAKDLTDLERDILDGKPAPIEARIRRADAERARSAAIRAGMQRAASTGVHVGRPADTEADILVKYPAVVQALKSGLSLRQAAKAAGVAVNTIRKVQALIKDQT